MHFEAYRDLIRSLEVEAARDSRGYALRVGLFGALGYAYIVGVFAGLTALLFLVQRLSRGSRSLLLVQPVLFLIPIAIVLLRVLVVRVGAPRGVPLERSRVPALFAMIDGAAAALHAPRPDRVLLTADYNCSALQRPRLGILGWPENVLMLGLPMLETLSPARFRAILAHELGHLAANHSTFAGRMHVVSDLWRQMLTRLAAQRGLTFHLFAPFFRWYGPRMQAMGFVLGRRQEYFADACARRVAGRRATRGALVRIETMARHHRAVTESLLHARLRDSAAPPEVHVAELARRMREDPPPERGARWLEETLRAETGYEHTHPALRDRLVVLDPHAAPTLDDVRAEPGPTAAEELLGAALESLTREVGARWVADMAPAWKARHDELAEAARTAGAPAEDGDADATSPEAAWRTLSARLAVDGEQNAVGPLTDFLAAHPEHAAAHYRLGRVLLRDGETAGLAHLDRAMELDSDAIPPGCGLAVDFLRAQGRGREAEAYTRRAWEFSELLQRVDQERRFLRRKDRLGPCGLPPATLATLRARLAREDWIAAAYLVRKEVDWRPERPCYVLAVRMRRRWYRLTDPNQEAVARRILMNDETIPDGTWLFLLEGDLRWARSRLAGVERALIWARPRRAAPRSESRRAA